MPPRRERRDRDAGVRRGRRRYDDRIHTIEQLLEALVCLDVELLGNDARLRHVGVVHADELESTDHLRCDATVDFAHRPGPDDAEADAITHERPACECGSVPVAIAADLDARRALRSRASSRARRA